MSHRRPQIIATIGPVSSKREVLCAMIEAGMDVARFNVSWGSMESRRAEIAAVRSAAAKAGRPVIIVIDLPGPRIQEKSGHTYDHAVASALTAHDRETIAAAAKEGVEYIAMSFVGSAEDVRACRKAIQDAGGRQRVIAKIERKAALAGIDAIIAAADAVMIARGDLGNEVPLEDMPFIEEDLIKRAKKAGKPVITATGMLLSMVWNAEPSRAEVTDVAYAVTRGSDAIMLSEETAAGNHPVEAVAEMAHIAAESMRHVPADSVLNPL